MSSLAMMILPGGYPRWSDPIKTPYSQAYGRVLLASYEANDMPIVTGRLTRGNTCNFLPTLHKKISMMKRILAAAAWINRFVCVQQKRRVIINVTVGALYRVYVV